jgi:hypothetical protein
MDAKCSGRRRDLADLLKPTRLGRQGRRHAQELRAIPGGHRELKAGKKDRDNYRAWHDERMFAYAAADALRTVHGPECGEFP